MFKCYIRLEKNACYINNNKIIAVITTQEKMAITIKIDWLHLIDLALQCWLIINWGTDNLMWNDRHSVVTLFCFSKYQEKNILFSPSAKCHRKMAPSKVTCFSMFLIEMVKVANFLLLKNIWYSSNAVL